MKDIPPEFNPETAPPRLEIDWDVYLPFFEDEDIPDEAKLELIEALWSIVVSFVDLGFGVHPVQHPCGKQNAFDEHLIADVLSCEGNPNEQQEQAVPAPAVREEKGSR